MTTAPTKLLNLGCGQRFHPDWVNVDFHSSDPAVMAHDLRQGIPFSGGSFDVVYHSHILEHFPVEAAHGFLVECFRVLKPGGLIRVAVPDLEQIARLYLKSLELARQGDAAWQHHYNWMMIELYDQTAREVSGGNFGRYLSREVVPNIDFVVMRQGKEAERTLAAAEQSRTRIRASQTHASGPAPGRGNGRYHAARQKVRRLVELVTSPSKLRERCVQQLLGTEYSLLQLGRFRRSGEIHQWMYDSYSLGQALVKAGFTGPCRTSAAESRMAGWVSFSLDTEPDGTVYKPDSLYMEAVKSGT